MQLGRMREVGHATAQMSQNRSLVREFIKETINFNGRTIPIRANRRVINARARMKQDNHVLFDGSLIYRKHFRVAHFEMLIHWMQLHALKAQIRTSMNLGDRVIHIAHHAHKRNDIRIIGIILQPIIELRHLTRIRRHGKNHRFRNAKLALSLPNAIERTGIKRRSTEVVSEISTHTRRKAIDPRVSVDIDNWAIGKNPRPRPFSRSSVTKMPNRPPVRIGVIGIMEMLLVLQNRFSRRPSLVRIKTPMNLMHFPGHNHPLSFH